MYNIKNIKNQSEQTDTEKRTHISYAIDDALPFTRLYAYCVCRYVYTEVFFPEKNHGLHLFFFNRKWCFDFFGVIQNRACNIFLGKIYPFAVNLSSPAV